jgi:hypothetical protein
LGAFTQHQQALQISALMGIPLRAIVALCSWSACSKLLGCLDPVFV